MKRILRGLLVAGSLATVAQADDINVFLSAGSSVFDPPTNQGQTFHFDQTTGLNTPTSYSVSSANGGGSSLDNTTVSMGTLHSYSYSTFPLDGTTSYSEGYVDLFTNDLTVVPAGITGLIDSFVLTGTTSPIPSGAPYAIEAVVYDNLIDVDNGDSNTNTAKTFFDLQNPGADIFSAPLTVKPGDRIEEAVEFEISTYQAGNAAQSFALVDYSETLNLFVDTNVPGVDLVDGSGHDYSSALASAPEPGTWALMGTGLMGFGLRARAKRRH